MVLLQNNNHLLPLSKNLRKIAVIGPMVKQRYALLASWVLDGLISETQNVIEAFKEALPNVEIPDPSRDGEEIAQCYLQDCVGSITLTPTEMGFYGLDKTRRVEPGQFKVWVGGHSQASLETEFTLQK